MFHHGTFFTPSGVCQIDPENQGVTIADKHSLGFQGRNDKPQIHKKMTYPALKIYHLKVKTFHPLSKILNQMCNVENGMKGWFFHWKRNSLKLWDKDTVNVLKLKLFLQNSLSLSWIIISHISTMKETCSLSLNTVRHFAGSLKLMVPELRKVFFFKLGSSKLSCC